MKKQLEMAPNTVLVVLVKEPKDLKIILDDNWYRIPKKGKMTPANLKKGIVEYVAFYIPKSKFSLEFGGIQYYAKLQEITEATSEMLFPERINHGNRAGKEYYKLSFEKPIKLTKPILCGHPRRILFVPTTEAKFFNTMLLEKPDINHLFSASPLEDILFKQFLENEIPSVRQYLLEIDKKKKKSYSLDFAIFCKKTNLNIECDGDNYHNSAEMVKKDKKRDNDLATHGWQKLRFTTEQLTDHLDETMQYVKETINQYGGFIDPSDPTLAHYISKGDRQLRLFD